MKGTRRDVLSLLENWLKGGQKEHVFWLNGLAGTGKSTIAQTFAEIGFMDGQLGASFFCSRDFSDRNNLRLIFPTLAFQLAFQYPHFRQQLLPVLVASPDVGRESLASQLEKLLVGPLLATQTPTLIIIDALDECHDEEPVSALLSVLSRYMDEIPLVKFFITARPEPRIRSGFHLKSLQPHVGVFGLHDVKPDVVNSDIKLFLKTQFAKLAKYRSDCDFTDEWPSQREIDTLCEKAAGFFIYASTVVKFVSSNYHSPSERLALIIMGKQDTSHEGKAGIDLLYTQVLEQAFHDVDSDELEPYPLFKLVVAAVLLAFNPLSMKALSDLLNVPYISSILHSLDSLLLVPTSEIAPVNILHKSFLHFLTDPGRCRDPRFFLDPSIHHATLLISCLKLMKKRLKRNMCNLDDHAILSEVKDLSARQKVNIGDALVYACRFWTSHLMVIPRDSPSILEVQEAIEDFSNKYLLFWIEVLALTGNLGTSEHAFKDVQEWCGLVSYRRVLITTCIHQCSDRNIL
jgi:hypothetical protein